MKITIGKESLGNPPEGSVVVVPQDTGRFDVLMPEADRYYLDQSCRTAEGAARYAEERTRWLRNDRIHAELEVARLAAIKKLDAELATALAMPDSEQKMDELFRLHSEARYDSVYEELSELRSDEIQQEILESWSDELEEEVEKALEEEMADAMADDFAEWLSDAEADAHGNHC
jgi:hypothetical protein